MDPDDRHLINSIRQIPAVPQILDVIHASANIGFVAITRIDGQRWLACAVKNTIGVGLEVGSTLDASETICNEVRGSGRAVIINHVSAHPDYSRHPNPVRFGYESCITMPITLADGSVFGTIFGVDHRPMPLDRPEVVGMVSLFAELIAYHLDADLRLTASTVALGDERETATLREQFIGILGHDLRNPLASLQSGTNLLLRTPLNERARMVVGLMQASVARMNELVGNMLDFTRTRLGGGINLVRSPTDLTPTLHQVIDEIRSIHPTRQIEATFDLPHTVNVDASRVGQLLSNLLSNALTHGAVTTPIRVVTTAADGTLVLSVTNGGPAIPPTAMQQLFKPFVRGSNNQGLGLGLHIAAEIARAHGGTIGVASTAAETCFTLELPTA